MRENIENTAGFKAVVDDLVLKCGRCPDLGVCMLKPSLCQRDSPEGMTGEDSQSQPSLDML